MVPVVIAAAAAGSAATAAAVALYPRVVGYIGGKLVDKATAPRED